jgi:CheY-like chemotaxis protein
MAFQTPMGGEGLLISYLSLVPLDEKPRLDRLLEEPDAEKRKRCLEVLGAREEDQLVPFFFKAMNDPVKEVGLVAIHQIGKLPSGFEAMMNLFRSGQLDRMREAIHFFGENHTQAAAKPLMGFLASESPDDLLVDAANALGNICDPTTANALLNQLHSGKPLLLQVALADTLRRLASPVASLGLLKKSEVLIFPQVLILALQGAMSAFPGFEEPFPIENLPALEHLVELCCDSREGAGQWMNAALAVQELYTFDPGVYSRLADRFTVFRNEMPLKSPRERETHERILEAIKKLSRRAESLSHLEEREKLLQGQLDEFTNAKGTKRLLALDQIIAVLADPWHILSQGFSQTLLALLREELARGVKDVKETATLCELAGLTRQSGLIEPLRDLYTHASNPELKTAAQKALLALGLAENDLERRSPVKSILLLEPNAFFRKRLASAMESKTRTIALAANRQEAEAVLSATPVDLLITEMQDEGGDMGPWIQKAWDQRHCRYVLLSASNHNPGFLAEKPWVIGRLYKPYPLDEVLRALEG